MSHSKKIAKILISVIVILTIIIIILGILKSQDKKKEENMNVLEENEKKEEIVEYQVKELKDPSKFFSVENCLQEQVNEKFRAKDIYWLEGITIETYIIQGEDAYYKVTINKDSLQYDIQAIDSKTFEMAKEGNIKPAEMKQNSKDGFEYLTITEEKMCRIYLERFSELQINKPKEAYKLIEEAYKKERFPNYSDFEEYVNKLKIQIKESVLSKYSVQYFDDYIEYTLVDTFNHSYTIIATGVMNYKIRLDNYTIKVADYDKNYAKLNEKEKVMSNIYIFLSMINTKDYEHAYKLLDSTFKEKNFTTLSQFKEFIDKNFFEYNIEVAGGKVQEQGKFYVYKTKIAESNSKAAEQKDLTIIMQLKEDNNFVISFSFE